MKKIIKSFYFLILLSLFACGNKMAYEASYDFKNKIWTSFEKVKFEFVPENENKQYDIYIDIVYTNSFPFEYLNFTSQFINPNGEERLRNYHEKLRDKTEIFTIPKTEKTFTKRVLIMQALVYSNTGKCKLVIENRMDKFESQGIESMKLIVISN